MTGYDKSPDYRGPEPPRWLLPVVILALVGIAGWSLLG